MHFGLYQSAQRYAQRAASALGEERWADFYVDAGVALEHLTKAVLVKRHRVLIIATQGEQLNLSGLEWAFEETTRPLPTTARTISCREAVRRASALLPGLAKMDLSGLIDARNGVVHVGSVPSHEVDQVAYVLARAASALLPELGMDEHGFWGHHYEPIQTRLSATQDRVRTIVAERIAAARERFEERIKRQSPDWLQLMDALVSTLISSPSVYGEQCPACAKTILLHGEVEVIEELAEGAHPSDPYAMTEQIDLLFVERAQCMFCELRFEDTSLFEEAGLPEQIHLGNHDYDDWEPDEDYERERE